MKKEIKWKIKSLIDEGYELKTKTTTKTNLINLKVAELYLTANDIEFSWIWSIQKNFYEENWFQIYFCPNNKEIGDYKIIDEKDEIEILKMILGDKYTPRNGEK